VIGKGIEPLKKPFLSCFIRVVY